MASFIRDTAECQLSADNSFGPAVHGCRGNFDFTLLFEQSFFQIAPSALLLLSVPFRASQLRRQNVKTLRTGFQAVKQTAIVALACTQLAMLVLWSISPIYRTRASIPAAVLSFLASVSLLFLSSIEHTRSVRPSSIINVFVLFSLLFDIPLARTLWLRAGPRSLPSIFTVGIAAKTVILYLEARSKRRSLFAPYRLYAPEALVSLYDRTVLWWLNPLFWDGYRGAISFERLYKIDSDLSSQSAETTFAAVWARWKTARVKRPLLWALASSVKWTMVAMLVPRLALAALKLSQPLLINRVTFVVGHPETEASKNAGYGLIGASALIYLGLAITNALFKRQLHRLLAKIRGILVTAVYSKALKLSSDKLSDNAALTLATTDINRITASLARSIDELVATPCEVAVAIFLLEREIQVSCIAPVALAVVISAISFMNSNTAVPMQKQWLSSVQERISYTASVLGCPKGFKMLGLTDYLSDRIQALRVKELVDYADYRKFVTRRNCFSLIPKAFGPVLTLMMFTLIQGGPALNPTVAFTTLSLVAILTQPILELIHAVPVFLTAIASLDRVQAFLLLEEDETGMSDATESLLSRSSASDGVSESLMISPRERPGAPLPPALSIQNGNVRLGKDKKLILRDINVQMAYDTLTLIVGPVGSGKSTLLKALVGDTALETGTRNHGPMAADFAYCAQDPWLPNDTVRNLILGHSDMDPAWYATTVEACALNIDIATFPLGDDTLIGTKGVSLSGGQRQRLALARALYSRKRVIVVDDTLSGLDANTARMVFDRTFGPQGLCKMHSLTVIFATHAIQYLQQADHIIALDKSGSIVEQGSFGQLDSQKGYVHSLNAKSYQPKDTDNEVAVEVIKAPPPVDKLATMQQDLARRTGDVSVYSYYCKSIGWRYGIIVATTATIFALMLTFPDVWVRWWSEAEVSGNSTHSLGYWIGIYFMFPVIGLCACFTNIWVMLVHTVPKSSAQLHKQLLTAVMRAPYSFFVNTDVGVTLNRFSNDMSLIEQEMAGAVMQTITGLGVCIASAALIAVGAKYVGITLPFLLLVLYLIQRFYLRTSRQIRYMDLEAQAPLLAHCQETISGVTTIRAFGWQQQSHEKCLTLLDKSQQPFYLMLCIQRWLNLVLDLTTAAIAVVVVAMAMTLRNTTSAGSIGVSMLNILSFNSQVANLITAWTSLETSIGAVARCKNFEQSTVSEDLPNETDIPPPEWPQSGALTLQNIAAAYVENGENVLKDVSLSIAAGEKVGICGRTGSGKSSMLLTLLRLLDNNTGTTTLDGIDLATVPRQIIRERLTALPQEAIFVPGSLKDNIDPLGTHSDETIKTALEKVGLRQCIEQQDGINASMSKLSLSQGQMQLFAVARSLLHKSKLLVIDEMTSSVDALTEEMMLNLVKEEFADSTVIAVAHRLKTIVDFDKVGVMDQGKLVEFGPPHELLEKRDGKFRAMWERSGH